MSARGLALGMVIILALVAGIGAYTVLIMAAAQSRQARGSVERSRSRYIAEAGLVWAQQQLLADPRWSSGSGTDVTIEGVNVDIIVPACAQTPCESRRVQARVNY